MIATLGGQVRQVAAGQVAINALVEAAKLLRTFKRQDQPPAPLDFERDPRLMRRPCRGRALRYCTGVGHAGRFLRRRFVCVITGRFGLRRMPLIKYQMR